MEKVDALVEQVLEEALLDVHLVGKHFAVEEPGEDLPHAGDSVVYAYESLA